MSTLISNTVSSEIAPVYEIGHKYSEDLILNYEHLIPQSLDQGWTM